MTEGDEVVSEKVVAPAAPDLQKREMFRSTRPSRENRGLPHGLAKPSFIETVSPYGWLRKTNS